MSVVRAHVEEPNIMEAFYYCCEHLPDIGQTIVGEALTTEYVKTSQPNEFVATVMSSFAQTHFFKQLRADLKCSYPMYKKTPSNTLYDWHVDGLPDNLSRRKCSINIPLTVSEHAGVFFRTALEGTFYNVHRAKYVLYKPTLLNVSHEHCVINDSDSDRIVLNLSINYFSYTDTVEYFKNLRLDDY